MLFHYIYEIRTVIETDRFPFCYVMFFFLFSFRIFVEVMCLFWRPCTKVDNIYIPTNLPLCGFLNKSRVKDVYFLN